jgi:hypothetical protein
LYSRCSKVTLQIKLSSPSNVHKHMIIELHQVKDVISCSLFTLALFYICSYFFLWRFVSSDHHFWFSFMWFIWRILLLVIGKVSVLYSRQVILHVLFILQTFLFILMIDIMFFLWVVLLFSLFISFLVLFSLITLLN